MYIKTVKSTKIKCLFLINESSFMKRKKGKQTMSNLASSQKTSRGCFNPNYRSLFLELCRTCASPSLERHSASAGMKRTLGWVTHFPWGSGQVHFTDFWPSSCTNYGMKRCYLWLVYEYLVVTGQKTPLVWHTYSSTWDTTPRKVEFLLANRLLPKYSALVNVCQHNYIGKASKRRPGPRPCSKGMSAGQPNCTAELIALPSLFFLSYICFSSSVRCISQRLTSS